MSTPNIHLTAAQIMSDDPWAGAQQAYHEAFHLLDPEWHEAALDVEANRTNLATMLFAWHRDHAAVPA